MSRPVTHFSWTNHGCFAITTWVCLLVLAIFALKMARYGAQLLCWVETLLVLGPSLWPGRLLDPWHWTDQTVMGVKQSRLRRQDYFSPSMMLPAFAYNNVSIAITARANHLALLTRIQAVAGIVGWLGSGYKPHYKLYACWEENTCLLTSFRVFLGAVNYVNTSVSRKPILSTIKHVKLINCIAKILGQKKRKTAKQASWNRVNQ